MTASVFKPSICIARRLFTTGLGSVRAGSDIKKENGVDLSSLFRFLSDHESCIASTGRTDSFKTVLLSEPIASDALRCMKVWHHVIILGMTSLVANSNIHGPSVVSA